MENSCCTETQACNMFCPFEAENIKIAQRSVGSACGRKSCSSPEQSRSQSQECLAVPQWENSKKGLESFHSKTHRPRADLVGLLRPRERRLTPPFKAWKQKRLKQKKQKTSTTSGLIWSLISQRATVEIPHPSIASFFPGGPLNSSPQNHRSCTEHSCRSRGPEVPAKSDASLMIQRSNLHVTFGLQHKT